MYNPKMPISAHATAVHKITDEMVSNCPEFSEDAKKLKKIFEDSVLIVYNGLKFDIPMLLAEFERAGITLDLSGEVIDVMLLETTLNPRTLSAVYKRYTDEDLEDAHDATADVEATRTVLKHQMLAIKNRKLDKNEIMKTCGVPEGGADFFGKLKYLDDGRLAFNFGKHKDLAILLNDDTKQYANWILTQNFPTQVKKLLQDELKKDVAKQFKKKTPAPTTDFAGRPIRKGFTQEMIEHKNRTGQSYSEVHDLFSFASKLPDDDLPF